MERYGNLQYVHSVEFPVSGEGTTGRLRRSRSFGSESEFTENHDADFKRHPCRSYSTDSIQRYYLQDPVRRPKYVSYVSVKDDNFAINRMRVPGRRVDRNYSDGSGQQNPAFMLDGVGFQNPAFTADSHSYVERARNSNNLTHPYLSDSVPMHLLAGNTRSYVDNNYSHENIPSTTIINPGEETNGHVNVVYVCDDEDWSSQKSVRSSPRKMRNNHVSPDNMERYHEEDGKTSRHSSPRKFSKNRVSSDTMEMTGLSYIGSSDGDQVSESIGFSDASLRSMERESSVHESKLDITVSSKTTYLVDDPRYLLGSVAAAEKQEQPENVGPSGAQDQQLPPPSESIESRRGKCVICPKALPAQWGRRKRVCSSVVGAICLVGLILFVSLFPASFIYVEYDQIALRRTKSTWKVDDETYYPGCYVHGPDMEFYRYNSTAQKEHFNEIDVFTADKNTLQFSATVYWFIRTEEMPDLYNKFGRNFSDVFPNIFLSSMRNVAPQFTSRDYMSKRNLIESTIHQALYDKVSGTCCPTCCSWKSGCSTKFINTRCSRCSKEPSCDKGHHIEIRYFYVGEIEIPWEIEGRYLKSLIVEVENEKAQFEQEEAVTRVKSDYLVKNILNQAEEIKAKSEAEAKKIKEIAGVDGDVIEQKATVSGLNGMCSKFSITEEDHKLSLFFFNSIKNMSNLYRFVYDN